MNAPECYRCGVRVKKGRNVCDDCRDDEDDSSDEEDHEQRVDELEEKVARGQI